MGELNNDRPKMENVKGFERKKCYKSGKHYDNDGNTKIENL